MRRRTAALLGAAALLLAGAPLAHADQTTSVTVSGRGGQVAQLVVGKGGAQLDLDLFSAPRLPGGDGAIGGLLVQRRDGTSAGGFLLQNPPEFSDAVAIPLVGLGSSRLPAGRYRVTLLGSGPQTAGLPLKGDVRTTHLRASGPATPVTRAAYAGEQVYSTWSEPLKLRGAEYLVAAAGAGGTLQQGDSTELCIRQAANDACVGGNGFGFSPGATSAASWSTLTLAPRTFEGGDYVFEGSVLGLGPLSRTAHAYVVVTPRR